jgi:nucleotide-binding universal stress UspA family protein
MSPGGTVTLGHVHRQGERARKDALLDRAGRQAPAGARKAGILCGRPGPGLCRLAGDRGADLLVIGCAHHGPVGRLALGDDTRTALDDAPCAVAIAPPGYADHTEPLIRVGVGLDRSPESRAALAIAREIAVAQGGRVRALEAVSLPAIAYAGYLAAAGVGETIQELMTAAQARLARLPDVEGHAVNGIAGESLAAFSAEVDILVVGSRGSGSVRRLVFGSTSRYLSHHARCPLLIVPRTAVDADRRGVEPGRAGVAPGIAVA